MSDTSLFEGLESVTPAKRVTGRSMLWYDGIIDDLLANPGTLVKDIALRLGRHEHTISTIMASDLFKSRYAQRRAQFNEMLNDRIHAKLTMVAEKALDSTISALDKKRDAIPLPILKDIAQVSLDRLGYGPKAAGTAVQVNVNTANVVSPEALASAREKLRLIEGSSREAGGRESQTPESAGRVGSGEGGGR